MAITKTYEEINEKISKGEAVILTAEEVKKMSEDEGVKNTARKVDVVTTGTFGAMCSSGIYINFGHSQPPIKMSKAWLNDVPLYCGLAAVDVYMGAAEISETEDNYGGAHVIEELLQGDDIQLKAQGKTTDCYPRKHIETSVNLKSLNECFLFNPRNAYQNYNAATNSTKHIIYTYMGMLLPGFGNITYSTTGELSPLLNDPLLKTIGIGTRIFLGGSSGFVVWNGTQFNTEVETNKKGIPTGPARTLSLVGDLKQMSADFLKPAVFEKYGVSMFVGIGVPIPILDEEIAEYVSVKDEYIETGVCDFGSEGHPVIAKTNYRELKSGEIELNGKKIKTGPLSSMKKAREIANILKEWIKEGSFLLSRPVQELPQKSSFKAMNSGEKKE